MASSSPEIVPTAGAIWERFGKFQALVADLDETLLETLSGNQALLRRGCERQAVLQGHVVPLGDPELKHRHGDTVEAVMPVRLGNATLRT